MECACGLLQEQSDMDPDTSADNKTDPVCCDLLFKIPMIIISSPEPKAHG